MCPPMVVLDPPVGPGGTDPAGETEGVEEGAGMGAGETVPPGPTSGRNGSRPVNTSFTCASAVGEGVGLGAATAGTPLAGADASDAGFFEPPDRNTK